MKTKETIVNDIMNLAIVLMVAALIFASAAIAGAQTAPKQQADTLKTTIIIKGVQCKGKTKSGLNCRKITRDTSGYCFMHKAKKEEEAGR